MTTEFERHTGTVGPCQLPRPWAVVDRAFAARLASVHREVLEVSAFRTDIGDEALTADIPNVTMEALQALGDDGLVAVGTEVRPGDILVGKITPRSVTMLSPEEKLLRAIFGENAGDVRDTSLRAHPGLSGTVVESSLIDAPGDREIARARVVVEWTRPLAVGDELRIGDEPAVVCALRDLPVDVSFALDSGSGERTVVKHALARDLIHARSIGPYSLVTQQPLRTREQFGGQALSMGQARALVGAQARSVLWEMLVVKSDSVPGRTRAYESLVVGRDVDPPEPPPPPSPSPSPPANEGPANDLFQFFEAPDPRRDTPESAQVLQAEIHGLGFTVDLSAPELELRLMTGDDVREMSQGPVRKPETLNYRTHVPEPGGLFCQVLFGPVADYECACGKYKRMRHRGVVCERCGVEVTQSSVRRRRFGHVEFCEPVAHPWLIDEIALLLGFERSQVERIIRGEEMLEGRWGGAALREALAALSLEDLASGAAEERARLAEALLERERQATDLVLEVLPVLPPDLRPLVPLEGGRWATSDLNDLYRRVINRNNRLSRLLELQAPEVILQNEHRQLFEAVAHLMANERCPRPLQFEGRELRSLLSLIDGRRETGLLVKTVDYSGIAALVADPSLDAGTCRVPRTMAEELFRPWAYGRMETEGYVSTIKAAKEALEQRQPFAIEASATVAKGTPVLLMCEDRVVSRRVALWDEPAIAVDVATAGALRGPQVTIHVPLGAQARQECEQLQDVPASRELEESGWFTRWLARGDAGEVLRRAAIYGEPERVADPHVRAALGQRV